MQNPLLPKFYTHNGKAFNDAYARLRSTILKKFFFFKEGREVDVEYGFRVIFI